jgi:drug/metabolite transporter (DMT)-like permease
MAICAKSRRGCPPHEVVRNADEGGSQIVGIILVAKDGAVLTTTTREGARGALHTTTTHEGADGTVLTTSTSEGAHVAFLTATTSEGAKGAERRCDDGMPVAEKRGTISMSKAKELQGTIALIGGCLLFSAANALAKTIVLRGSTELALITTRGFVCYPLNGILLALRGDPSLKSVMLFRLVDNDTNIRHVKLLAYLRGLSNAVVLFILFVAWDNWITIADAMAIFVAGMTIATASLARVVLGSAEKVSANTVGGGVLTLLGAFFVIQPSWMFTSTQHAPAHPAGVILCALAALGCTVFNFFTRYLFVTSSGTISSAMFLSFEATSQWTFGLTAGICGLAFSSITKHPTPHWLHLHFPSELSTWGLSLVYCALVTGGQLSLAVGFSNVPAGKAAIYSVSELAFAWGISVCVLQEPTSILAALGSFIVFLGTAIVGAQNEQQI